MADFFERRCACCGYYSITEIKETCSVCYWEEDIYREEDIDDNCGPNRVLRQAKVVEVQENDTSPVQKPISKIKRPFCKEILINIIC
ncbi:MAG: hypothetical protein HRT61_08530 [Ekhidna sp.]|nr:hypothetical protein [Ekhidna sp.]